MALQTQNLVVVGLSVDGDDPPNQAQPPLVDGIHLRWAFKRELGFPWYGFFLFRRPYRTGKMLSLRSAMSALQVGQLPSAHLNLNTAAGQVNLRSDANLVLTNKFPPNDVVEFDLSERYFLRLTLPPGEPARRIYLRLGFHDQSTVSITALFGETPVVQKVVPGQTVRLSSDAWNLTRSRPWRLGRGRRHW